MEQVKQYSSEFGLDYRLILALMKQESKFDHESVSEKGAYGLMQIMPITSSEIADKLEIEDVKMPRENIMAGVFYLASLYDLFKDLNQADRVALTLAAYNAGPSRIYDAQELAAYMGENPKSWSGVKSALPLLSKRFYSLHHAVWEGGRPKSGYFGEWKQTISYVENVKANYSAYCEALGNP